MSFEVIYSKQALKDAKKVRGSALHTKVKAMIAALCEDPFHTPPPFERLVGDLSGYYSRRINIQHRLVYQVYEQERVVKVIRMWSHYE